MTDPGELSRIARVAAHRGAQTIRNSTPNDIRLKGDRDLVTEIDVSVEREIREYLKNITPEIAFLGEEEGRRESSKENAAVWTLDPIDGTSNFAHGLPLCAVSLALVSGGVSTVAAIVAPYLGLEYHAIQGEGAYGNGHRLRVSTTSELSKAIVSIGDYAVGEHATEKNERRFAVTAALAKNVERVRMFGTAALDLAWVAEGRTDATVLLSNKPWDTAAGVLIAREAGANVTDASGQPHTFQSAETIASAPGLTASLLPLLR